MDIRVRVGPEREVSLPYGAEVPLLDDEEPVEAHVELTCPCGHRTRSRGPVAFESHDPDRFDRHEFMYASHHAEPCRHCASPLSGTFRYTVTRRRDTGRRSLSLDTPTGADRDETSPVEWF